MEPLVTVVTPVADSHVHLLPRLAHSLQLQTIQPNWLIVNDGLSAIPEFGAKIIETGGHKGTAYARNLGIDTVTTPFLLFVDADDYLIDTATETFLRAYAAYDACYIYSDWYQFNKDKTYSTHKAKNYDRVRQIRHSLHLVTTFMPTDVAKIYFDINYRGWEDWEFHIRLGEKGFCGARLPEPLLIYDMGTSINREKHNDIQHEVYPEIQQRYAEYLQGDREFMPCQTCGGGKARAQVVINTLPPSPEEGKVVLEYIGQNTGAIPYRVNRRTYRGGNNDTDKFVQVEPQDVEGLLNYQVFRKVAKSFKPPTPPPSVQEFEEWREMNKTEPPKDWVDLFKNPKHQTKVAETEPTEKKARRGRPKGAKNKPNAVVVPQETEIAG